MPGPRPSSPSISISASTQHLNISVFLFFLSLPGLAKTSPFVLIPELFGLHLGAFLLGKYAHLQRAYVTVQQLRWQRISVDGKEHPHSFWRDGDEKRVVDVEVRRRLAGQ